MNLEVFSASGGMAEGFRRAGIAFDLVVDYDTDACDSYEANLGHRPIQMDVRDLLRLVRSGWRPGPVDLLVADPPCAPWSRAGKRRGLEDERDMLEETAELVRLLRPRAYLIGNIPGLQDAPSWGVVQRVIGGLARDGYCVVDFAELDAADYGVAQHRRRPFWHGHLEGPCIRWPAPTHGDPVRAAHALPGLALRPWVSCREALQHLPLEDLGRPVRMKIRPNRNKGAEGGKIGSDTTRCSAPDRPAATVVSHATSKGGQILLSEAHRPNRLDEPSQTLGAKVRNVGPQVLEVEARDRHPMSNLDAPARAIHADGGRAGRREATLTLHDLPQSERPSSPDAPALTLNAKVPRAGEGNALLEWPWARPATTVTADPNGRLAPPGHRPEEGIGSIMSNPNAVVLSERAAAILQGFPDGWVFCGRTKHARWSQLGQAVPPPLAEAIARAVLDAMSRRQQEQLAAATGAP